MYQCQETPTSDHPINNNPQIKSLNQVKVLRLYEPAKDHNTHGFQYPQHDMPLAHTSIISNQNPWSCAITLWHFSHKWHIYRTNSKSGHRVSQICLFQCPLVLHSFSVVIIVKIILYYVSFLKSDNFHFSISIFLSWWHS